MIEKPHTVITTQSIYLDLLKRVLTDTIWAKEPNRDGSLGVDFVKQFSDHYIHGNAISLLPLSRFQNLEECMLDVVNNNVEGDFIETGVWRGGAVIFMRAFLKSFNISDRNVWVADSFEGLPCPDKTKFPLEFKAHKNLIEPLYDNFEASLEEVKGNFKKFDLLDDQVQFLKGWFKDTLPSAPFQKLAIVRLDGDYYESTMDGLNNLYDRIPVNSYLIVDDYAEDTWTECRRATDEFRVNRNIKDKLIMVDSACAFWKKTSI
jgi:hypothetical protein